MASEFRITQSEGLYTVAHYVGNDPNPTPTQQRFEVRHDAETNAYGRAAKLSILSDKPVYVMLTSGHRYSVKTVGVKVK